MFTLRFSNIVENQDFPALLERYNILRDNHLDLTEEFELAYQDYVHQRRQIRRLERALTTLGVRL